MRVHARAVIACLVALCAACTNADVETPESATARRFAAIKNNPALLLPLLREMPKGGDLHNHLSGSIYAETYLRWAAEDKLCLSIATMAIVEGTCNTATQPPVTAVLSSAALYAQAIDAMSMRHWSRGLNGHDHFFATFSKFRLASGPARTGDMIAEVASRAAAERVSYIELMLTPASIATNRIAGEVGWNPDFAQLRDALLSAGFSDAVASEARQRLDTAEARERELLRCGTPQADAGCAVVVRYISQVARAGAPAQVFAQMLAGFELASAEPRVVSLNLVQPEDNPVAVRDFELHMTMLDFLHGVYPAVRITLHADEFALGLVPPEALHFHIRDSLQRGHASRIGHGTAVMHEDDAPGLLREMAAKRVLVEIALSSTDLILDVKGNRHPLTTYLQFGVPVALVTDDMGVLRSTHTQEFMKAVEDQGLDYRTLKTLARNSLQYAFVDATTKSRLKSDLEKAFRAFEVRVSRQAAPLAR